MFLNQDNIAIVIMYFANAISLKTLALARFLTNMIKKSFFVENFYEKQKIRILGVPCFAVFSISFGQNMDNSANIRR